MIAISSSFRKALIAISIDGAKYYKQIDANVQHSENILPAIEEILDERNLKLKDNDKYAIVIGPGSFTGIRIGIALIKGLIAGGCGEKIIPLTTFDEMAYSFIKNNKVDEDFYCVINALSELYFVCKYNKNGEKISEEKIIDAQSYAKLEGIKVSLEEEGLTENTVDVTAEDLLELAFLRDKKENYISEKQLVPMYLRKSQAEVSLEEKTKNKKI